MKYYKCMLITVSVLIINFVTTEKTTKYISPWIVNDFGITTNLTAFVVTSFNVKLPTHSKHCGARILSTYISTKIVDVITDIHYNNDHLHIVVYSGTKLSKVNILGKYWCHRERVYHES